MSKAARLIFKKGLLVEGNGHKIRGMINVCTVNARSLKAAKQMAVATIICRTPTMCSLLSYLVGSMNETLKYSGLKTSHLGSKLS